MATNEHNCAYCGEKLETHWSAKHPASTICDKCQKEIVKRHNANDYLAKCPFCGGNVLEYILRAPYFYGAEGVLVRCKTCGATSGYGGIIKRETLDLSVPPIFNAETIENGFTKAQEKWNRRADNG